MPNTFSLENDLVHDEDEAREVAESIFVSNSPIRTWVEVYNGNIETHFVVPDRDDPTKMAQAYLSKGLSFPVSREVLLGIMKDEIVKVFTHEALERIVVDGKRKYDPHATVAELVDALA